MSLYCSIRVVSLWADTHLRLALQWFCSHFLITHSNEEKKICLGMRPESLECPPFLISLSRAVYCNVFYVDSHSFFHLPPSSFLHKICSSHDAGCNLGCRVRFWEQFRLLVLSLLICAQVWVSHQLVWGQRQVSLMLVEVLLLSEAVRKAKSSCVQLRHALIWTLPAFLTWLEQACCWVMLRFCPFTWPKFCHTSPPAMVLSAKLAEMTQLTSTPTCWLEICMRNTIHL